jgi:DNA-binding transcriptional MerR regulator
MSSKKAKSAKRRASAPVEIPDKLYFRIGEVSRLCRVPAYVLRFWETEFPQLKPGKGNTGQRMYRRKEVESVLRIKHLLYEEGFTIAGARAQLREDHKAGKQAPLPFSDHTKAGLRPIKQGLEDILKILKPAKR